MNYPKGFTVILIPLSEDKSCTVPLKWKELGSRAKLNPLRNKMISLKIRSIEKPKLHSMLLIQIIVFIITCLLAFLVFCFYDRKLKYIDT